MRDRVSRGAMIVPVEPRRQISGDADVVSLGIGDAPEDVDDAPVTVDHASEAPRCAPTRIRE